MKSCYFDDKRKGWLRESQNGMSVDDGASSMTQKPSSVLKIVNAAGLSF